MAEPEAPTHTVKTARLELRVLQESNLNDFHAIWINPKVAVWTTRGPSNSLEESKARMVGLLPNADKPESLNFGVFIRPSPHTPSSPEVIATQPAPDINRMIGVIGVFRASIAGTAEVGYIFHESFWGRGYASEALTAYVNVYWDQVRTIDAMVAMVDPENVASIKVLRNCGFIEVEYMVGDIVLPALGRRDTIVFRIERPKAAC